MDCVGKALWYIETHFEDEVALEEVATVAGLSKFHLVRAFGTCFGKSVMRYVRKRRPRPIGFGVALGDVGWGRRVACGT